ncbi:MAG: N,N-dimethylformamidase beta subunit family domain-containing protein [Acidimicrobiales bacterium]
MLFSAPASASVHRHHTTPAATFAGPSGREARWVVDENKKPGTARWKIAGPQSATGIMGYANLVQATQGNVVTLYVSTQAPTFEVQAFRMGYYGGTGARLVWHSKQVTGTVQPACPVTPGINMVQCAWSASTSFPITRRWVQGEYLLKLVGSRGQESYVPLTVSDPMSHATYVIMDGVLTTQVFNPFGGYDLYQGATPCAPRIYPCSSRSLVVSFDRPYANDYGNGAGTYLSLVYPLTRLAEEHGLDVTYWTDLTLAAADYPLTNHRVLISTGHDEEWSLSMRDRTVSAANQGVNLIFFGASAILRKVRLQASPLGPNRQIVNYRDPQADPLYGIDNAQVSQNQWIQPPANWSPSELVGANYIGYNNGAAAPLVDSDPSSWLFAHSGLRAGGTVPGVLANDFQQYQPSAPEPPNVTILAHSPVQVESHGTLFADTTYYSMGSGNAGVFDSGTTQWIPDLASCPATQAGCPAPTMRVLTENLLRVFGQGPAGVRHPSTSNVNEFYG